MNHLYARYQINKFFKVSALALTVAASLSGCGGSSNNNSAPVVPSDPVNPPDRSVTPLFALCHDADLNGQCSTEESPKTFTTQAEAIAQVANAGSGPVIIRGNDNSLLMADAKAEQASAWSSLLYNEMFFNPEAGAGITAYLRDKLGLDSDALSAAQGDALNASVAASLAANGEANPYTVVAAVIDQALTQGSFDNILVTADKLKQVRPLVQVFDEAPKASVMASWEPSDHDERVDRIMVQGDNLIALNRWHNRLVIVNASADDQKPVSQPFAALSTSGHHIESTDVDFVSGASEHRLSDAWLNESGDVLYALVDGPHSDSTPAEDDTYGLFRVPLIDGKLPDHKVASIDNSVQLSAPHRAPGVARIANKSLSLATQIPGGRVLAYDSEAGYVRVYTNDLVEDTGSAFPLDASVRSWGLVDNGKQLVVLLNEAEHGQPRKLLSYSTDTLQKVRSIDLPSTVSKVITQPSSPRALLLDKNAVHVVDVSTFALSTTALPATPSSMSSLSPSGDKAALVFKSAIHIANLAEAFFIFEGSLRYGKRLRALSFNGDNTLVYSSTSGELQKVSLSGLKSSPKTAETLLKESLDAVEEGTLNHQYPLSAVAYPLHMPMNYEAATYRWSSANGYVVTDNSDAQGTINQPDVGGDNVSETVTVKAHYNFRGKVTESDSKSFDITIRPKADVKQQAVVALSGVAGSLPMSKMAINADGKSVALYTPGDEGNGAGIIIIERKNNGVVPGNMVPLPAEYAGATVEGMSWNGTASNQVHLIVHGAQSKNDKRNDGITRIISWNAATNAWTIGAPLGGKTLRLGVGYSQDGNVISVVLDREGSETSVVKTLNAQTLQDIATIATDAPVNARFAPVLTPTNDGQQVMGYLRKERVRYLNRYVVGTGNEPESTAVRSRPAWGFEYDNASDILVRGNFDAEVELINTAINGGDYAAPVKFATVRGAYNGTADDDHHAGRIYALAAQGDDVYVWTGDRGLAALDISEQNNIKERFWAPMAHTAFGEMSADGKTLYTYAYDEDAKSGKIGILETGR